jgi:hypothetical protein
MSTQQTIAELEKQIAALKAQIPQVKIGANADGKGGLTVKIGEKGTLNVYGLGRFPVCLYVTQAAKLNELMNSESFKQFVAANMSKLSIKES